MRRCPKCGAEYSRESLQTICGACLTPLEISGEDAMSPAEDAAAAEPVAAPAPGQAPEIPPGVIPEVPQIRPTPPPAEPVPAPVTPQPQPGVPVPPFVPVPQPQPAPVPAPAPAPQPQPMPVPQPLPTPEPTPPEPSRPSSVKKEPVFTALLPEQINNSRTYSYILAALGAITGIFAILVLFNTDYQEFGVATLFWVALFIIASVFLIRQAIYHSAICHVKVTPLRKPKLGEPLPVQITIGVMRTIPVTDVELVLRGTETLSGGTGRSRLASKAIVHDQTIRVTVPKAWPGGKEITFIAEVPIPAKAMPTFVGHNFQVAWSLSLWVGIPGWYPDIRQQGALVVTPLRAPSETGPAIATRKVPLAQFGGLQAQLGLDCAVDEYLMPVLPVNRPVQYTVTVTPQQEYGKQRIWMEINYTITGENGNEEATVESVPLFLGGWTAGESNIQTGTLLIPSTVPLSYRGQLMRVSWKLAFFRRTEQNYTEHQSVDVWVAAPEAQLGE